ncbi:hypothetical protein EDB89DRAFT_2065947 [Lactarius sanguifluus]|nr:hypothetical protein EDB89DRAFT_2065947 [Lactarius sanguifluus]
MTGLQDLVIATFQQPRQPPRPTAMTMATTTTTTTATTTGDYSDDDYIYGGYGHHSDDGYDDYGRRLQRRQHLWRLTNRRYSHHRHNGYDNYDDDYTSSSTQPLSPPYCLFFPAILTFMDHLGLVDENIPQRCSNISMAPETLKVAYPSLTGCSMQVTSMTVSIGAPGGSY